MINFKIVDVSDRESSVLEKEIWNTAIEAAAKECYDTVISERIRKLKK